jgi:hypothetical protein
MAEKCIFSRYIRSKKIMSSNSDLKYGPKTNVCLFTKYVKYLFYCCEMMYYALHVTTCDLYANQLEIRLR